MAEPILRVEGLVVADGATSTIQGLTFRLEPATLTALIGPDDADKDALVAALTGRRRVSKGTLRLHGRPITGLAAAARVRAGLVATARPLLPAPAGRLVEAVTIGMAARRPLLATPWWRRRASASQTAAAAAVLAFVGLGEHADAAPTSLTQALAARLELAAALALGPRLLVVDRLTRGLESADRAAVGGLLAQVAAGGIGVLWLEDDVDLVGEVAASALVLAGGRLVAGGPIEVLAHSRTAETAFLGEAP